MESVAVPSEMEVAVLPVDTPYSGCTISYSSTKHCTNVISSLSQCKEAATVLDLIFWTVGSWSSPPGCYHSKGYVYYNTNLNSARACSGSDTYHMNVVNKFN